MPTINVHSSTPQGGKGQMSEANYMNNNVDRANRQTRSEAEYINRSMDDAAKALRQAAEYFNRDFDTASRKMRQEADYENKNRDIRYKRDRSLAEYENKNQTDILRKRTIFENQTYKRERSLAEYENTNRDRTQRQQERLLRRARQDEDKKYRDERRLAEYENRNFDLRAAKRRRDGQNPDSGERPGFFGRAMLGGAYMMGGNRLRGRVSHAFGINGGRGDGSGGVGSDDELAAFGMTTKSFAGIGLAYEAAKVAYKIGKAVVSIPQEYDSALSGAVSGASPYNDLVIAGANAGRGGGFRGNDLTGRLYQGTRPPAWMWQRGITSPLQAMGILGAYGGSITSGEAGQGLLTDVGNAFMSPYIGGMAHERYAQSFGLANQLGITNPRGATSGATGGGDGYSSRDEYMREMQKTTAVGVTMGIGNAQVFDNIESLLRQSISMGATSVSAGATGDYWSKYLSSGSPSARTGEMQANALAGQSYASRQMGFGGGVAQNAGLYQYSAGKFKGGVPSDVGSFAKAYGIDISTLSSAQQSELKDAHKAALAGNWTVAGTLLPDFLQGPEHADVMNQILSSATNGMPDYARPLALAQMQRITPATVYAGQGQGTRGYQSGVGMSSQLLEAYQILRGQGHSQTEAEGILGSLAGVETNYFKTNDPGEQRKGQVTLGGGGMGAHGIGQLRGSRLTRFMNEHGGKLPEDTDMKTQLDFLDEEWKSSEAGNVGSVRGASSPYQAGSAFQSDFQRSGDAHGEYGNAGNSAEAIHQMLANVPMGPNGMPIYQSQGTAGAAHTAAGEQMAATLGTMTPDFMLKLNDAVVKLTDSFTNLLTPSNRLAGPSFSRIFLGDPTNGAVSPPVRQ